MSKLKEALQQTQTTYKELVEIADGLLKPYTSEIDDIIKNTTNKVENLTNEEVRNVMLTLSLRAYTLGEVKEKSSLKCVCAETLRDEKYARVFNESDGAIKTKENIALLESSYETLSQAVFDEVYSMLKTKSDEVHRVVDSLKNILISRASEAKLTPTMSIGNENERTYIGE